MLLRIAATAAFLGVARAVPRGIPDSDTAREQLLKLPVIFFVDRGDYERDYFGSGWDTIENACQAREIVLQRDGENIKTDDECRAVSGTWYSPYDGVTLKQASKVDIDHMVPLKNAWISGANEWTDDQREEFANDLIRPQLWAVSATSNRQKSDNTPDKWKPPLKEIHCDYAASWVAVKSYWNLTVIEDESGALFEMLRDCDSDGSSAPSSTSGTDGGSPTGVGSSATPTSDNTGVAPRLGSAFGLVGLVVGAVASVLL